MAWPHFSGNELEFIGLDNNNIIMFIDLYMLTKKYSFTPSTIFHAGAHEAQELERYINCGAKKIFWIEGNSELVHNLKKKLNPEINTVIEGIVSSTCGEDVIFNIANNSQSSSILELGSHKTLFPSIHYVAEQKKKTITLDSIINEYFPSGEIDLLNIDIQGPELKALKGTTENLSRVNNIYLEINTEEVYKECGTVKEIDSFLKDFSFERVETQMYMSQPWGDGFYIKNET